MKPAVVILNAALGGEDGNTSLLLSRAENILRSNANVNRITLRGSQDFDGALRAIHQAQALVLGTGTHWDSWSSLLQGFLEYATPSEGTSTWLGKPAGVIVTMHSVGGKGVLSRLQGVLNTFGCSLPPMTGMVYSQASQALIAREESGSEDTWSPEDIKIICHNLLAALKPSPRFKKWPVDRSEYSRKWIHD